MFVRTFDTSRYGSQTVKPLPIRSIAALRNAVCKGNFGEWGACNKCVSAMLVCLARLLFPIPKPSTIELFRLCSLSLFWLVVVTSCPNSAPITPSNTTAVVCFRFSSATLDGFLTTFISANVRKVIKPKVFSKTYATRLFLPSTSSSSSSSSSACDSDGGTGLPEVGGLWFCDCDDTMGSWVLYIGKYCDQLSTSVFLPFGPILPNSARSRAWAASRI